MNHHTSTILYILLVACTTTVYAQKEFDQSFDPLTPVKVQLTEISQQLTEASDYNQQQKLQLKFCKLLTVSAQYDQGIESARIGIKNALSADDIAIEIQFRQLLIKIFLIQDELMKASREIKSLDEKATSIEDSLLYAELLKSKAMYQLAQGEFVAANNNAISALAIITRKNGKDDYSRVDYLLSLGATLRMLSLYENKREVCEEARKIAEKHLHENHFKLAEIYHSLGLVYWNLGFTAKSDQYNLQSIQIREKLFGKDYPLLSSNHNTASANYISQRKYERAVESGWESNRIAKTNFGESHLQALRALTNISISLNALGKLDQALELNKLVLSARQNIYPPSHEEIAKAHHALGISYKYMGKYALAKKHYQKAIDIRKKYWSHNKRLAASLGDMALCETNLGQFKSGIEYANKSLMASNPTIEKMDFYGWPSSTLNMGFSSYYWAATMKIYCLFSLAAVDPDSSKFHYQSALEGTHFLDSLLITRLNRVTYTEDKFLFSENSHRAMELGFWSALSLSQQTESDQYRNEVFYFNERSKANVLLVKSQAEKAKSFARLPEEVLQDERKFLENLERKKSEYLSLISNNYPSPAQNKALSEIYESEEALTEFKESIKSRYPKYHELRHQVKPVTVDQVQDYLAKNTSNVACLEYLVRQGNVYYSMITKDTIINLYQPYDNNDWMLDKVQRFRKAILNKSDSAFYHHSRHLADLLINPVLPALDSLEINSLIVIPDESLNYVPFEILITDTTKNSYLLEDFEIRYANSMTLLINENHESQGYEMISFAPDFSQDVPADSPSDLVRSGFAKLPGAIEEVEAISASMDNKIYKDDQATESNFRKHAANYSIIHLATHAIIDEENDETAKLIFTINNDSENDGYLYSHEIYNLDLDAQLITLSACNTGFGKIKKGEGVMSLSRAFAYAGVPATVVSLWPASDKSTPELMKYFYQNLKDGQDKDVALNNARKQYLATAKGKARHPFYWGGFVLIGDSSPIEEDRNLLVWMIPSVLLFAMILTVYRRKRKTISAKKLLS